MSSPLHQTGHLFLVVAHRCILMPFHPLYPFAPDWHHLHHSSLDSVSGDSSHVGNKLESPTETSMSSGLCSCLCMVMSEVGVRDAGELAACRRGLQECDGHSDALPQ